VGCKYLTYPPINLSINCLQQLSNKPSVPPSEKPTAPPTRKPGAPPPTQTETARKWT
jgi:hypothetical protein